MNAKKWLYLLIMVVIVSLLSHIPTICSGAETNLVVVEHADLTGPLRQQGIVLGTTDYYKYVNEKKLLGENVKIVHIWADDHYETDKTLAFYQSVKGRNPIVWHSNHTTGQIALKPLLEADQVASITQSPPGAAMYPPATIYAICPTYPDMLAMFIDYLVKTMKEKPRLALLSGENPFGRDPDIDSVANYAKAQGVEIVAREYVPSLPVDVTTNLRRIKERGANAIYTQAVDITLTPVLKNAVRLGIRDQFTWGCVGFFIFNRAIIASKKDPDIAKGLEGLVAPYAFAEWTETNIAGVKFMKNLVSQYQKKDDMGSDNQTYTMGVCNAMVATEAIRLALKKVPAEKLTGRDVIEYGIWQIKNFDPMGLNQALISFGKDLPRSGIRVSRPAMIKDGRFIRLPIELTPRGLK